MNKMVKKLKGVRAKLRNNKAFTLIELLVVVAIIGILVLLALPRYVGYTKDANVATMQADIRVLESASLIHNIEGEGWPETGTALAETVAGVAKAKAADATAEVKAIDKALLKDQIQSLKNEVEAYGIITKGDNVGQVVHLAGEEDRAGNTHFGLSDELVTSVTPS